MLAVLSNKRKKDKMAAARAVLEAVKAEAIGIHISTIDIENAQAVGS